MKKIEFLYFSTFIFWFATNLISPFLAVFTISKISHSTLSDFGFSSLIYFLSFGLTILLIGKYTDMYKGEKDDILIAILGYFTRGILFILFAFITSLSHLYLLQLLLGISRAFTDSVKEKLQLKLISSKNISSSFSVSTGITNLAAALGSGIGGILASIYGFENVLILVGVLTIFSGIVYFFSVKKLLK